MMTVIKTLRSFRFAFAGLRAAFRKQHNFRVAAVAGIGCITLGFIVGLSPIEWAGVIIIITLVLSLELLNTAVEAVVDLASPKQHELAKIAKDSAAAAVLLFMPASIVIGLLIFAPKILVLLKIL